MKKYFLFLFFVYQNSLIIAFESTYVDMQLLLIQTEHFLNGIYKKLNDLSVNKASKSPEQTQAMHSASLWLEFKSDDPSPLAKQDMINGYVSDCTQYSTENKRIPKHSKNDNAVRIMTYNVYEWQDPNKKDSFKRILDVIRDINPDILILQEVRYYQDKRLENSFSEMGYSLSNFCNAPYGNHMFGNMIFSKYPFKEMKNEIKTFDIDARSSATEKRCYVKATIELPGKKEITVYGTHLDVWDKTGKKSTAEIKELIDDVSGKKGSFLIAADFNSVRERDYNYEVNGLMVWDTLTKITMRLSANFKPVTEPLDLLERNGFTDCFAKIGFQSPRFTVWSGTAVDFIYMNQNWQLPILGSYVYYSAASDHIPVITDIAVS